MAGQRQPIELVVAKGKKHLTKAEIEKRQRTEMKADTAVKVTAPKYLTPDQKKQFNKIVKELKKTGMVSALDTDALARLVIAQSNYLKITAEIEQQPVVVKTVDEDGREIERVNPVVNKLLLMQDRCFKQCRQGAADFGLTISARCRLSAPDTTPTEPKKNKFVEMFA